jgi:hypothetical protein
LIETLRPLSVIPGHGAWFSGEERVRDALTRARSRLAAFVVDPRRHASHGMKVLIKFKLLEWQSVMLEELARWADAMPYMRAVHSRFFPELSFCTWIETLTEELIKSRALGRDGAMIYNV